MKTLQECKDEVAINKGFKNWSSVDWYQINEVMQITTPPYAEEKLFLQASKLFESQYREEIQRKDEENKELKQWKESQIKQSKKWDKVHNFAQESHLFKVGDDIPQTIVNILVDHEKKDEEIERLKEAVRNRDAVINNRDIEIKAIRKANDELESELVKANQFKRELLTFIKDAKGGVSNMSWSSRAIVDEVIRLCKITAPIETSSNEVNEATIAKKVIEAFDYPEEIIEEAERIAQSYSGPEKTGFFHGYIARWRQVDEVKPVEQTKELKRYNPNYLNMERINRIRKEIMDLTEQGRYSLEQIAFDEKALEKIIISERNDTAQDIIDFCNALKNVVITNTKPYSTGCIDTIDAVIEQSERLKINQ